MTRRSKTPTPHSRKHKKMGKIIPEARCCRGGVPTAGDPRP
jgi:hypothetical protein